MPGCTIEHLPMNVQVTYGEHPLHHKQAAFPCLAYCAVLIASAGSAKCFGTRLLLLDDSFH